MKKGKEGRQRKALKRLRDKLEAGGLNEADTQLIKAEIANLEMNLGERERPAHKANTAHPGKPLTQEEARVSSNKAANLVAMLAEKTDPGEVTEEFPTVVKKNRVMDILGQLDKPANDELLGNPNPMDTTEEERQKDIGEALAKEMVSDNGREYELQEYPDCPKCKGTGRKYPNFKNAKTPCDECEGTGKAQNILGA